MIDPRPVLFIVGHLLSLLAAFMVLPAIVDFTSDNPEWRAFAASAAVTLFFGAALALGTAAEDDHRERIPSLRQAFLATALGWVACCLFAALPLTLGPAHLSPVDAVFEATSGLTTTASTVIAGLDRQAPGLLLWRGLLQWLGGMGIIVMAVAVLPVLNIGGMQIFRVEMAAPSDRSAPRAARVGTTLVAAYVALTAGLGLALWLAGMGPFTAAIHAMTTISTGGFSTSDTSVGHFANPAVETVLTLGMVLGGLPFLLFFRLLHGNPRTVLRDQQLRWYLGLLAVAATAVALWLVRVKGLPGGEALRHGAFTVVSVMTGTGYYTLDYSGWAGMPVAILFFLTFVGGCAGSTAAGIKVFRFQLLLANALVSIRQVLRPHAVLIPTFNRRQIPDEVLESAMGFLFVYALSFAVLAMALGLMGLDFITAVSGAASAISNLGPGLGETIGPGSTFAPLPDAAKLLLAGGMLFGRVEMFVFLVLFVPSFWRQ
ncbi:MAG: TrkH family potassium uptake protein [Magnetospirillum sp.]|nr:TrkH family potassium uptake protein [Magnetospirillum sp.]